MSKLTEYLKLIPKGIPDSISIVKAIINDVKFKKQQLPEDEQKEIIKRRVICSTCPFMSKNAPTSQEYLTLFKQPYETKRIDPHCSFCSCPIDTRTAALDKDCGIVTYNEENPDTQLPLKWTKYGRKNSEESTSNGTDGNS